MKALGLHILADMHGCDPAILNDAEAIQVCLIEAAQCCGATIVSHCFHRFSPHGVSGVVVIAESHLAIHTWPEHGYAAVDLFTGGNSLDSESCLAYVRETLHSRHYSTSYLLRGSQPRIAEDHADD
jgi:S-adenosylmethionine decarboxylase proenzyme